MSLLERVRSLKRCVSGKESGESGSPQCTASASIPASPSFSDFSLNTGADAEKEYDGPKASESCRSSFEEYLPSSPKWPFRSPFVGGLSLPTASIPIPKSVEAALKTQPTAPPSAPPRHREAKISGMDYYDYCELIRSSSL